MKFPMKFIGKIVKTILPTLIGIFGVVGLVGAVNNLVVSSPGTGGGSGGCTNNCTFTGTTILSSSTSTNSTSTFMDVTVLFRSLGNTTLGDSAALDTITPTARFSGDLIPSADNTFSVGTSSLAWRMVETKNVSTTNITVGGNITLGSNITLAPSASSTNANPVGTIAGPNGSNTKLVKSGNYLYATGFTNDTFSVYDVTIPSAPTLKYTSSSATSFPEPWFIASDSQYVFVSNLYSKGVSIFSLATASSSQPSLVIQGPLGTTGTLSMVADGRFLYKLSASGTLNILDYRNLATGVTTDTTMTLSSSTNFGTSVLASMAKDGNYLYITGVGGQFIIVDVTNPLAPRETFNGMVTTPWDIRVQNGKAYITQYTNNSISVYDVRDPYAPTRISILNNADIIPTDTDIAGHYFYASNFNSQFAIGIYNIATAATPTRIGYVGFGNYGFSTIIVDGSFLYTYEVTNNLISLYRLPSIDTAGILSGSAEFGNMSVNKRAYIGDKLEVAGDVSIERNMSARGNSILSNAVILNATTSRLYVQDPTQSTGTSTMSVGKSVTGGSCLELGDVDGAGFTYCTVANGTMSCGTTSCK